MDVISALREARKIIIIETLETTAFKIITKVAGVSIYQFECQVVLSKYLTT